MKSQGPIFRGLDKALESFNVHRQAYYSGTFVGNHVHASLKVTFSIIIIKQQYNKMSVGAQH